ncbi:hypothetical protein [Streptomyces alfalfae]
MTLAPSSVEQFAPTAWWRMTVCQMKVYGVHGESGRTSVRL